MDEMYHSDLETVIPGVRDAYRRLRSKEGRGLYTSRGTFFNMTIFGRDAAMSAKFVADFDHQAAVEVIKTLVALQGTKRNDKTQEARGRIHHEWRDFRLWKGSPLERLPFWVFHRRWDVRNRLLLTYFSLDTTASFIRLVHKYATRIDRTILDMPVKDREGNEITVRAALEAAAEWIVDAVDNDGLLGERRRNRWSLPFQTFQDSFYARADGTLLDCGDKVTYIEVQAFAADALYDMAHLFPSHAKYRIWRETGLRMQYAMLTKFRQEDLYFGAAIDKHGQSDVANVSAGWILNSFVWREMKDDQREAYIVPIVERLFSDDFLTPVGLRTRSADQADPVKDTVDYHGSETVWPMFSFMVIEGLRRHRMYGLAEQLENRVINGLNLAETFPEYHIVKRDGSVILPVVKRAARVLDAQMRPESNIGFSVVPAMVMAWRAINPGEKLKQQPWQTALEDRILARIELVDRAEPRLARSKIGKVEERRVRRLLANVRVARYFWRQRGNVARR